jgi:hypothetical protein
MHPYTVSIMLAFLYWLNIGLPPSTRRLSSS